MKAFFGAAIAAALAVFSVFPACTGTDIPDPEEYAFKGQVRSAEGDPASGARVIALRQQGPVSPEAAEHGMVSTDTVFADNGGAFTFGKSLATGNYDLFFEDTAAEARNHPMQHSDAYRGNGTYDMGTVQLAPASMLLVAVKDADYPAYASQAHCSIVGTPYTRGTGHEGIAVFFLPPDTTYQVSCYAIDHDTPRHEGQTQVRLAPGDSLQIELNLLANPSEQPSLLPPAALAVDYDTNSGIAKLTWPPVTDPRLFKYGVGRADYDRGGGTDEFTTFNTYFVDAPFDRADSVQQKTLQYGVYCMKRDAAGDQGARRVYAKLTALRPWAYGARIDSLARILPAKGYKPGDTVRVLARWANRARGNDSLYWRVGGAASVREVRANPPASGTDTLSFVPPDTGAYEVNITIRDAEGYRSWLSVLLSL